MCFAGVLTCCAGVIENHNFVLLSVIIHCSYTNHVLICCIRDTPCGLGAVGQPTKGKVPSLNPCHVIFILLFFANGWERFSKVCNSPPPPGLSIPLPSPQSPYTLPSPSRAAPPPLLPIRAIPSNEWWCLQRIENVLTGIANVLRGLQVFWNPS